MLFNNSKLRDKQSQMLYTYLLFQFLSVSLKVPRLSVCFVVSLLSSWTAVTQTHLQTQLRKRRRRKRSAVVECSSSGCAACNVMSLWKYSEEVKCIYCSGFFCATINPTGNHRLLFWACFLFLFSPLWKCLKPPLQVLTGQVHLCLLIIHFFPKFYSLHLPDFNKVMLNPQVWVALVWSSVSPACGSKQWCHCDTETGLLPN